MGKRKCLLSTCHPGSLPGWYSTGVKWHHTKGRGASRGEV